METVKLANLFGKPEIFHSVQGEGKNMGKPSVFIRTSLCNLHCVWCDTDYTWNWEGTKFKHNKDADPNYSKYDIKKMVLETPIEQIYAEVAPTQCLNIVLTGGEPMMQQPALVALMRHFRAQNPQYFFEIETNGTLAPSAEFEALANQYNVSPKLANSATPQKLREKAKAYQYFAKSEKAVFKFVVANPTDLEEVLGLCGQYAIPRQKVYLMPEGTTQAALRAKQQWLVEVCKAQQMNYTDRLHIHIYGDKRGV